MKTKVLSIKKIEQFDSAKNHLDGLQVVVLLGDSQKNFTFTGRKTKIGNRELTIFSEDENFAKTFQFNDNIGIEITNLVKKVAQGEDLNFPIPVSDFSTPEQALTKQKSFESEYNDILAIPGLLERIKQNQATPKTDYTNWRNIQSDE